MQHPTEELRADMMTNFLALKDQSKVQSSKLDRILELMEAQHEQSSTCQDKQLIGETESNSVIETLKEEKKRLIDLLQSNSEKDESCITQLEEQLHLYRSKYAETESRLLKYQAADEKKTQDLAQLQRQVQQHEKDLSQALSLVDSLQFKLNQAEDKLKENHKTVVDSDQLGDQVKSIMNKVYKESLKQFRPDETYSYRSIKSILSLVIRVSYSSHLNFCPVSLVG